jgi:hypothetical protein
MEYTEWELHHQCLKSNGQGYGLQSGWTWCSQHTWMWPQLRAREGCELPAAQHLLGISMLQQWALLAICWLVMHSAVSFWAPALQKEKRWPRLAANDMIHNIIRRLSKLRSIIRCRRYFPKSVNPVGRNKQMLAMWHLHTSDYVMRALVTSRI